MLESFDAPLAGIPRRGIERFLRARIALDEILQFSKDHFHEQGLRAGPSAPKPSERGREDDDAGEEQEHGDGEDGHVLWPENLPKNRETPVDNVKEKQGVAVDTDERARKQNNEEPPP